MLFQTLHFYIWHIRKVNLSYLFPLNGFIAEAVPQFLDEDFNFKSPLKAFLKKQKQKNPQHFPSSWHGHSWLHWAVGSSKFFPINPKGPSFVFFCGLYNTRCSPSCLTPPSLTTSLFWGDEVAPVYDHNFLHMYIHKCTGYGYGCINVSEHPVQNIKSFHERPFLTFLCIVTLYKTSSYASFTAWKLLLLAARWVEV